jgi:hypothetical protein
MANPSQSQVPKKFRLNSVRVRRPGGVFRYGTLAEALEEIRPWVAFGQAVRVFEKTFRL